MDFDRHLILSLFHIFFVVPLFLYIGYQRASTPDWLYTSILVIGIFLIAYHGFKLINRIHTRSGYAWVNAIHVFLVAPLLIYIGYHKREAPRAAYEMLNMLAFAAGGYHLYSLVKMVNVTHEDY
jgi:hypothetical protein